MVSAIVKAVPDSPEKRELDALEVIFEDCKEAYLMGGDAIRTIREKKLWKASGYKSWEEYCPHRWKVTSGEMNKRIKDWEAFTRLVIPEGVEPANTHFRSINGFPREMQQEILDLAIKTAPGGKCTEGWINQVGQNLMDARQAEMNAAAREASSSQASPDDEEEEEDTEEAIENEDRAEEEGEEEPEATQEETPAISPSSRATRDAVNHPIAKKEQIAIWEGQAKRTVHKLGRLALSLNCTEEDLLDKYRN